MLTNYIYSPPPSSNTLPLSTPTLAASQLHVLLLFIFGINIPEFSECCPDCIQRCGHPLDHKQLTNRKQESDSSSPSSFRCRVGPWRCLHIHADGFLPLSCAGSHSCCELLSATFVSCPEVSISQLSSPYASSYSLPKPLIRGFPSPGW